jgi:hypothetical protein
MNTLKELSDFIDKTEIPLEKYNIIEYPIDYYHSIQYHCNDNQYYTYIINLDSGEEEINEIENIDCTELKVGIHQITEEEFKNFKAFVMENINYFKED